jgi:hypothetical protein
MPRVPYTYIHVQHVSDWPTGASHELYTINEWYHSNSWKYICMLGLIVANWQKKILFPSMWQKEHDSMHYLIWIQYG